MKHRARFRAPTGLSPMGASPSRPTRKERLSSSADSSRDAKQSSSTSLTENISTKSDAHVEVAVAPETTSETPPVSNTPPPNASSVSEDTIESAVVDIVPSDAKKRVTVLHVENVETYEDNTNQTGLSAYEMKAQDKFFLVPERKRSKAYVEAVEADKRKREERKQKKEEKKSSRRKSKGRKGQNEEAEILPNTVPWAIQNAKRTGVVNLAKMNLERFPEEIFESIPGTARIINISFNRMTELDPRICDYVLVQRLIANGNLLTSVHPSIRRMTALKKLDLAQNGLRSLPDAFSAMTQLCDVDLSDNKLSELPPSFADLQLTALKLNGNNFKVAPKQIESMSTLTDLNVSNNQLTEIPESWMSLTRLKTLNLDNNQISDCPNVILQMCADLKTLRIRKNPIKMSILEAKDCYHAFEERRRMKLRRQIDSASVTLQDLEPADR